MADVTTEVSSPEPRGKARALISVASLLFGISAWVSINGLWVQLPLLVPQLPEGWNLGAILVIVIQVANLGPLAYTVVRKRVKAKLATHITLLVGLLAGILMVFLWDFTVNNHSVAFIALAFFLALVDCTSSVLFMPFMARYPQQFLFWYMVGEGLSGLLPATLALVQGVGSQSASNSTGNATTEAEGPRFSVEIFFTLLSIIVAISWAAFALLAHHPTALAHQISGNSLRDKSKPGSKYGSTDNMGFVPEEGCPNSSGASVEVPEARPPPLSIDPAAVSSCAPRVPLEPWKKTLMLVMQAVIAALSNGILLAIQTYSSLPYGQLPYHLTTNLATIANPLSCAVAGLLPLRNLAGLVVLALGGLFCAGYILFLAVESPTPILVGTVTGAALMVFAWVAFVCLMTYVKSRLAAGMMDHGGAKSLLWYGVATQAGSFTGAILMYFITTYTTIFHSA